MNQRNFIELIEQHRDRLVSSMILITRNRDAAEDVVADALGTALQKSGSFRGESSLYTWVHAIARNEALDWRRKQNRACQQPIEELSRPELVEPDLMVQTLHRQECCARLRCILRKLPAIYRRVLIDHFVRGYRTKRIARRQRIPLNTVLSRIHNGKRLLREAWEAIR